MALRLTEQAERDLDEIYVHGALRFGTGQAERYSDDLYDCLELLATQPWMAPERTELAKPLRIHAHGHHIVAYDIAGSDLVVLRILPQRSDWQRLL